MNQEEISEKLASATKGATYQGSLTPFVAQSIEKAKSNYPVTNLLNYCKDMNLKMVMVDMATEDKFYPQSVLEVHKILGLLMDRYNVDPNLVYRKTAIHYTPPKSFDEGELEKMQSAGKRFLTPLSIKTLLAVCDVIHCDFLFEPK